MTISRRLLKSKNSILPCNFNEKKQVLKLLSQNKHFKDQKFDLTLNSDGTLQDQYNDRYEIYKGDFSNEGIIEYALISTGGSGNYNDVSVYKLINNHLVDVDLGKIISTDLLHGGDVGPDFYGHTADPFAIIKNGKTYIRFMDYPDDQSYDKTKLLLCTYLWEKNKITLSEPNLTFSRTTGRLVGTNKCMG